VMFDPSNNETANYVSGGAPIMAILAGGYLLVAKLARPRWTARGCMLRFRRCMLRLRGSNVVSGVKIGVPGVNWGLKPESHRGTHNVSTPTYDDQ
jgi:hypothetical protein